MMVRPYVPRSTTTTRVRVTATAEFFRRRSADDGQNNYYHNNNNNIIILLFSIKPLKLYYSSKNLNCLTSTVYTKTKGRWNKKNLSTSKDYTTKIGKNENFKMIITKII